MTQQLFPVERTLDFTLKQGFIVLADNAENASDKVDEFTNSAWDAATADRLGLVQVSDELEQIENSHEVRAGEEPIPAEQAAIDPSLRTLLLENRAAKMLAMLQKISATPQMYLAGISELGMEVKALVEDIESEQAMPRIALDALIRASGR